MVWFTITGYITSPYSHFENSHLLSQFELNVGDRAFLLTPEMVTVKSYQKTVHGVIGVLHIV